MSSLRLGLPLVPPGPSLTILADIFYRAEVNKSLWIEQDDRWILNLQGLTVTEIGVSYRLSLRIDVDISVSLASPCTLSDDVGADRQETRLDPEWQDVVPALALFQRGGALGRGPQDRRAAVGVRQRHAAHM